MQLQSLKATCLFKKITILSDFKITHQINTVKIITCLDQVSLLFSFQKLIISLIDFYFYISIYFKATNVKGTIKWFHRVRGFGLIDSEDVNKDKRKCFCSLYFTETYFY